MAAQQTVDSATCGSAPALPEPPYHPDTRAKGWRFELDYERIEQSDTWALANALGLRHWLLMIWYEAWKQTPAGTLPNDDTIVAARIGMPLKELQQHKAVLLRGWVEHADGRLYQTGMTECVLAMIDKRDEDRARQRAWRAKQRAAASSGSAPVSVTRDTRVTTAKSSVSSPPGPEPGPEPEPGPGQGTKGEGETPPPCPHQEIVDLYHAALPTHQRVAVLTDHRTKLIDDRWRQVWDERRKRGNKCDADTLRARFADYFASVAESKLLTGKVPGRDSRPPFVAGLTWLMAQENFVNVIEGKYHESAP